MGASTKTGFMDGSLKREEVAVTFAKWQAEAAYEDGNSYSGNWNMASGLQFFEGVQPSVDAAVSFLDGRTNKWDAASAVRVKEVVRTVKKSPTFAGKGVKDVYNSSSQPVFNVDYARFDAPTKVIPADELSASAKARLLKAVAAEEKTRKEFSAATNALNSLARSLADEKARVTATDLGRVRKTYFATKKAHEKAASALETLTVSLRERLYKFDEKTVERWMIYAVCAE